MLPSHEAVAHALARRSHWRILPATELARRRIGLSDEDPNLPKYLSTGPKTRVEYAPGHEVLLVHSAAKLFDGLTNEAAIVISALSDLDKHRITIDEIAHLSKELAPDVKENLIENLSLVPPRLRPIIELICDCYGRSIVRVRIGKKLKIDTAQQAALRCKREPPAFLLYTSHLKMCNLYQPLI